VVSLYQQLMKGNFELAKETPVAACLVSLEITIIRNNVILSPYEML